MRVLVAGATGVIGKQLLPLLGSAGHDTIALMRPVGHLSVMERAGIATAMERAGIKVVAADALDRDAVFLAVREAAPDAIVNMLTAIPAQINPRRLAKDFEQTNRLRTIGTSNLIEAGAFAGAQQVISQGLAYAYDPHSSSLAGEDTPLWWQPPKQFAPVLAALKELEQRTRDAGGLVL
ncbi:MAG TPA: NAD-dependent epimerase/dehydratase family protein, partial [Streptosporangiaceae bacterium]